MDERRADNTSLLMDLAQRTARIEARGEARDEWQRRVDEKLDKFDRTQADTSRKLDTVIQEITTAKTVARWGSGLLGKLLPLAPAAGAGAIAAWLAQVFNRTP